MSKVLYFVLAFFIFVSLAEGFIIFNISSAYSDVYSDNHELCSLLNGQTDLTNTCIDLMNEITNQNVSHSVYIDACKASLP